MTFAYPDDMPGEDELEAALLAAARKLGQCPHVNGTGQRCNGVAGHTYPDHRYPEEAP